ALRPLGRAGRSPAGAPARAASRSRRRRPARGAGSPRAGDLARARGRRQSGGPDLARPGRPGLSGDPGHTRSGGEGPSGRGPPNVSAVEEAVTALAAGQPVVLPFDTVYGLAADPYRSEPTERLYRLKQRPQTQPSALVATDLD